jgi:RNA polymerase-binding transcription factor DksA
MKASRRAHFRAVLESERDRLQELLAEANMLPALIGAAPPGEESEPGVGGGAAIDDTALIARASASLADVQRALQLLASQPDAFGICTACGAPIADDRLELVPTTRRCARHAEIAA